MSLQLHLRKLPKVAAFAAVWTMMCWLQGIAFAQSTKTASSSEAAAPLPKFDIISVRETRSSIMRERIPADGYAGEGVFLSQLIMGAYGIQIFNRIIGLPSWYREKQFNVTAKVDPADIPSLQKLSFDQRRSMLRQVLEERFQFKLHEEERINPIYVLTSTGKPGPFLQSSSAPEQTDHAEAVTHPKIDRWRRGQLTAERFTMPNLADQLTRMLQVDVVDQTHLDGLYNVQLDWNPDDGNPSAAATTSAADPAADKPSIFTAVREQLGLKLTPSKGPVKVWVIDHVELPSEN